MSKFHSQLRILLILGACMLLAAGCSPAEEATVGQMSEAEFANYALQNYVSYALTEKNVAGFGFRDLKEAQTAVVGDPLEVAVLTLNTLKELKPDTPARSLFTGTSKLYYPVLVNGEVRTKIEIVKIEDKWVAGEFGGLDSPRLVGEMVRKMPELLRASDLAEAKATLLVDVPVLHATLLYVEAQEQGYFIPAMVQPERFGLENGVVYPTEKILAIFSDLAQEIKADQVE